MEAANDERIKAVSLSYLLVDGCVSPHDLMLPLLKIHTKVGIIWRNVVYLWNLSCDCVDDQIAKGEDIQLGGVDRVLNSTLGRHIEEVSRIGRQSSAHCGVYIS